MVRRSLKRTGPGKFGTVVGKAILCLHGWVALFEMCRNVAQRALVALIELMVEANRCLMRLDWKRQQPASRLELVHNEFVARAGSRVDRQNVLQDAGAGCCRKIRLAGETVYRR